MKYTLSPVILWTLCLHAVVNEYHDRAKNADSAGFIHKPIDIKSLKYKVFELLGS